MIRYAPAALLLAAWLPPRAALAVVEPPKMSLVERQTAIETMAEKRIQEDILDKVFGPGRASVFVDVELQLRATRKDNMRAGAGTAEKYKSKGDKAATLGTQYILPGVPKPKNIVGEEEVKKPEAAQAQLAQQVKTMEEELYTQTQDFKKFEVLVIRDAGIPKAKEDQARDLILEAMGKYKLQKDDIQFRDAAYQKPEIDWRDDIREPKVYLPLLYAFLFLLLLWFLFGPFAGFLRAYTEALVQKPAAEVNVESNIEPPEEEGEGKGGGGGGPEEGQLDILLGRKPAPPQEEDMGKFEPFTFITEDNLKRLAQLFLLRRDEPWLIAVVISYLRPDYARQILSFLSVKAQTQVAMESLKVRQITGEQIRAIDKDIKENVDFVVGGIERLINMIEESDPLTRTKILESLQNEKPVVYAHVRKMIILFDDIPGFPDREMQMIVRELKTESMARALQGASPEVVNKFFNNMSAGAASLLKESMEYQKELTEVQIEEERTKILEQVKAMEKEGRIAVRDTSQDEDFQEVLAVDEGPRRPGSSAGPSGAGAEAEADKGGGAGTDSPPGTAEPTEPEAGQERGPGPGTAAGPAGAVDLEQAQRHFDAGVQQQQAGNLDEAVKCFQRAIEMNPELWDAYQYLGQGLYQAGRTAEAVMYYEKYLEHNPDPDLRAWVDSFKTQMGA